MMFELASNRFSRETKTARAVDLVAAKISIKEIQDDLVKKNNSYGAARSAEAPSLENVMRMSIEARRETPKFFPTVFSVQMFPNVTILLIHASTTSTIISRVVSMPQIRTR